ncbi:MAG TPA: phosphopantetheine-binding protein [Pseudonocardiaceae bacterium]
MDTVTDAVVDPELRGRVIGSIAGLLPKVLRREVPPVPEDTGLFAELGLTSAATLELLLELEEDLEIQIDVEDIDQDDLRSVGTLADFVASHAITD